MCVDVALSSEQSRHRRRMALIGEAMLQRSAAACDRLPHVLANQYGPERRISAGEPFAQQNNVWHDSPMLHREILAGAASARHHFVGNQENAVAVADFTDALDVAIGRRGAGSRADNGL